MFCDACLHPLECFDGSEATMMTVERTSVCILVKKNQLSALLFQGKKPLLTLGEDEFR